MTRLLTNHGRRLSSSSTQSVRHRQGLTCWFRADPRQCRTCPDLRSPLSRHRPARFMRRHAPPHTLEATPRSGARADDREQVAALAEVSAGGHRGSVEMTYVIRATPTRTPLIPQTALPAAEGDNLSHDKRDFVLLHTRCCG